MDGETNDKNEDTWKEKLRWKACSICILFVYFHCITWDVREFKYKTWRFAFVYIQPSIFIVSSNKINKIFCQTTFMKSIFLSLKLFMCLHTSFKILLSRSYLGMRADGEFNISYCSTFYLIPSNSIQWIHTQASWLWADRRNIKDIILQHYVAEGYL